jgi:transcription elongation factor Elf1
VAARPITLARAQHIARSHPCVRCGEYSFKKVTVKPASDAHKKELNVSWHAVRVCGVCHTRQELGLDPEGDIVYEG